MQLFYSFAVAPISSIQSPMIGWSYRANYLMNITERRSAPHSAPVRVLRSAIAPLALMWCSVFADFFCAAVYVTWWTRSGSLL